MFLKIIHYALFGSSPSVRDYMFANGVDRDTVHLNDVKFFKSVMYILVSSQLYQTISLRTFSYLSALFTIFVGESVWLQIKDYTGLVL